MEIVQARQAESGKAERPCEGRLLIVARQLSEPVRELLRSAEISWVERLSGTYRLVGPGLLIEVTVKAADHHHPKAPARGRLRDKSGLLAEILLQLKRNERFSATEIAKRAGISTALTSRILQRLTQLKTVQRTGTGPFGYWEVADPGALLDVWVAEERSRPDLSRGIYVWSRSPVGVYEKLPKLNEAAASWALGGVSAANLYAPTLTTYPDPTVWVSARIPAQKIAEVIGGELVDKGANMQIWQSDTDVALQHSIDWSAPIGRPAGVVRVAGMRIVSQPRAYVEAMSGAGRSTEAARNLRQAILDDALK